MTTVRSVYRRSRSCVTVLTLARSRRCCPSSTAVPNGAKSKSDSRTDRPGDASTRGAQYGALSWGGGTRDSVARFGDANPRGVGAAILAAWGLHLYDGRQHETWPACCRSVTVVFLQIEARLFCVP